MSTQEFKPGDRAEYVGGDQSKVQTEGLIGKVGTVSSTGDPNDPDTVVVDWDNDNAALKVVLAGNLRKVEPEFVVGQQVKDEDYDRLPIGAVTSGIRKVGEHEWQSDKTGAPMFDAPYATRFLTHLPDAAEHSDTDSLTDSDTVTESTCSHCGRTFPMHDGNDCAGDWSTAEPEDADDVEPEPLKEGDWVQVWAEVQLSDQYAVEQGHFRLMVHGGGERRTLYAQPDAIVRPDAGQLPPWVKPARCTSLYEHVGSLHRCDLDAGHEDHPGHHNVNVGWTTADEAGRITEGGAS